MSPAKVASTDLECRPLLRRSDAKFYSASILILAFDPISGVHFNSVVTLADAWQRGTA